MVEELRPGPQSESHGDAIRLHLVGLVEDGEEVPEEDEPPMVATVDVPLPIATKV